MICVLCVLCVLLYALWGPALFLLSSLFLVLCPICVLCMLYTLWATPFSSNKLCAGCYTFYACNACYTRYEIRPTFRLSSLFWVLCLLWVLYMLWKLWDPPSFNKLCTGCYTCYACYACYTCYDFRPLSSYRHCYEWCATRLRHDIHVLSSIPFLLQLLGCVLCALGLLYMLDALIGPARFFLSMLSVLCVLWMLYTL